MRLACAVADMPARRRRSREDDDAGLRGWKYFEMLGAGAPAPLRQAGPPPNRFKRYRLNIGICLCNEYNEVFVARRSDDGTSWQMPQGGMRLGETPVEACLRELTEETGLQPEHVELVQESRRWLRYQHDFSCHDDLTGEYTAFNGQSQRWCLFRLRPGAEAHIDLEYEWKRTGGAEPPEFTDWQWMEVRVGPSRRFPSRGTPPLTPPPPLPAHASPGAGAALQARRVPPRHRGVWVCL